MTGIKTNGKLYLKLQNFDS